MTRPKPGECGACHWFEAAPGAQPIGDPDNPVAVGTCCANPPVLGQGMQEIPGSRLSAKGVQYQQVPMGIRPPTAANGRCKEWTPAGSFPALRH